ncbi:MAG: hypothetical protein ACTSSJ_07680 [Candidatus Odinarchaeia archaeon]
MKVSNFLETVFKVFEKEEDACLILESLILYFEDLLVTIDIYIA